MKKYEEKTVKRNILTKIICDLCGKEVKPSRTDEWPVQEDTGAQPEECIKTHLEKSHYTYYGGADWSVKRQFVDLCPNCVERIFKWLKHQGCTIQIEEDGS